MKHVADWTTKATHIPTHTQRHSQMRWQSRDLLKFIYRFVNLEKANDKAPRDVSWRLLRKKGILEQGVGQTRAKICCDTTGDIEGGLHQGSV